MIEIKSQDQYLADVKAGHEEFVCGRDSSGCEVQVPFESGRHLRVNWEKLGVHMHEATLPTIEEAKMVICSKCLEKINQLLKTREARADDSLPKELETFPISSTAKSMADKRREHAEALNREEEEKARKEKKHQEVLAELENIKQFLSSVPYSDGVKTRPLNGGVARRPSNNGQNGSPDTAMAAQLKEKGLAPTE